MAQRTAISRTPAAQEVRKSRGRWNREDHIRPRDYSPTLGRFIERDPIGFEAGDNNWYRFVANGPTAKTDPNGLELIVTGGSTIPTVVPPTASLTQVPRAVTSTSDQALEAIARINLQQVKHGTNTCERYALRLEHLIRALHHPGVSGVDIQAFALIPVKGAPWIVQLTLTTGHAAVKVSLKDGRVFYYDNGAFGGSDRRFQLNEIPPYAYPGQPPQGIAENFSGYWKEAYPPQNCSLGNFDPYGP